MDGDHFDALLRSLSEMPSRRKALRLLAGSALGGLLTLGTISTDAKKGGKGKGKGKSRLPDPPAHRPAGRGCGVSKTNAASARGRAQLG